MSLLDLPLADLTVDDLEQLPDDYRYELHEGNLVIKSPAIMWHSLMGRRIATHFVEQGRPAYQEAGVKFGNRDSRTLDVAVFREEIDLEKAFFPPSAVAIAIEVVSPSSAEDDRISKSHHYARAGIPEYWRVERAEDLQDAVIYMFKLAHSVDGDAAYVDNGVTTLSALEK